MSPPLEPGMVPPLGRELSRPLDREAGTAPAPDHEYEAPTSRAARALRRVASLPIVVYQRVISPGLPRRCRYEPTCSRYAVLAIRDYGILRGLVLAAWRLVRCNPWSPGGYDPVGAQRLFKAGPPAHVRH